MTDSPHSGLSTSRDTGPGAAPDPTISNQQEPPHPLLLRPEQRAPIGDASRTCGRYRGRPAGRSLTPPPTSTRPRPAENTPKKINHKNKRVDRPRSYRDDCQSGPARPLIWENRLHTGRGDAVRRSPGLFGPVEVRRVLHICSTPVSQRVHVLTI